MATEAVSIGSARRKAFQHKVGSRIVLSVLLREKHGSVHRALTQWWRVVAAAHSDATRAAARHAAEAAVAARLAAAAASDQQARDAAAAGTAIQVMSENSRLQAAAARRVRLHAQSMGAARLCSTVRRYELWSLASACRTWRALPKLPSWHDLLAQRDETIESLRMRLTRLEEQLSPSQRPPPPATPELQPPTSEPICVTEPTQRPPPPPPVSARGPPPRSVDAIFGADQPDDSIDYDEFCELLEHREAGNAHDELDRLQDADMRTRLFNEIDRAEGAREGCGRILLSEYILWAVRERLSRARGKVIDLFRQWDADKSGQIDLKEVNASGHSRSLTPSRIPSSLSLTHLLTSHSHSSPPLLTLPPSCLPQFRQVVNAMGFSCGKRIAKAVFETLDVREIRRANPPMPLSPLHVVFPANVLMSSRPPTLRAFDPTLRSPYTCTCWQLDGGGTIEYAELHKQLKRGPVTQKLASSP